MEALVLKTLYPHLVVERSPRVRANLVLYLHIPPNRWRRLSWYERSYGVRCVPLRASRQLRRNETSSPLKAPTIRAQRVVRSSQFARHP